MEELKGENITVLPYKEIKKISDLISFEGPVLSHFKDKYGKDLLFYWIDLNELINRWLIFQVSEEQLYKYLLKNISLKNLIESPLNDICYSVEIDDKIDYKNIVQIFKGDLNEKYLPEDESFFAFEIPNFYSKKIAKYEESILKQSFLQSALYVKAEPNKKAKIRNLGLLDTFNAADCLNGYGNSYKGLIIYKARKEFHNRGIVDEKRVKKATRQLAEKSLLNLVKSEAASFAIGLSPNNIMDVDEPFLGKKWRDEVFTIFKRDVIEIDKKTEDEVNKIIEDYGEDYIYDIYKPIIELYNNKNIEINITDKNFITKRLVNPIKKDIVRKLIQNKIEVEEEPEDRLALVKVSNRTGKITGAAQATLFDQSIQTSWSTDEIRAEAKTYKLRHKLFAEYRKEKSLHIIEMEVLGIYATGDSLPEAEMNFYNEFHTLYERLSTTENKDLLYQEIEKKNYLLLYVKR